MFISKYFTMIYINSESNTSAYAYYRQEHASIVSLFLAYNKQLILNNCKT